MPASYPDLNRCNYLYQPGDRRCLNYIEGPGLAVCKWHRQVLDRQQATAERRTARAVSAAQHRAALDGYMRWVADHPLVTATNLHLATHHLHLLIAAGSVSTREAALLLGTVRELRRTYREVRWEYKFPDSTSHLPVAGDFLRHFREQIEPAIAADRQCAAEAAQAAAEAAAEEEPLNHFPRPQGPPLTDEDYARNQEAFFAAVRAQRTATEAEARAAYTAQDSTAIVESVEPGAAPVALPVDGAQTSAPPGATLFNESASAAPSENAVASPNPPSSPDLSALREKSLADAAQLLRNTLPAILKRHPQLGNAAATRKSTSAKSRRHPAAPGARRAGRSS